MRILVAIVHFWDPHGDGNHQSLRPDPQPRIRALQEQLLGLRRIGPLQGLLNIAALQVQNANQAVRHVIDVKVITDGEHHVLDRLDPAYAGVFEQINTGPPTGRHLGFEAQKYLASQLEAGYDLYAYMEDDLIIHDPLFFQKIAWFAQVKGPEAVLLPHRMELWHEPGFIDRFYIDGPIDTAVLRDVIPDPQPSMAAAIPGGEVQFESPLNPHAGCFVLTQAQLEHWSGQPHWQDGDCSYVSPLESAATLGLVKTFQLYKTSYSQASWLELQHWGQNFRCLIGRNVAPME